MGRCGCLEHDSDRSRQPGLRRVAMIVVRTAFVATLLGMGCAGPVTAVGADGDAVEAGPPSLDPGPTPSPSEWFASSSETPEPTWVAGADYLLLRPSFSNSTAMLSNTRAGGLVGFTPLSSTLDAIPYDFGYSGGVRAFLGYQATPDHVFRFTYLNYYAQTTAVGVASGNWAGGNGTIVVGPYNTGADAPGESITSTGRVGLNMYDLDWGRRIDVDTDGDRCPVWDVAAGAGIRFLDSRVTSDVSNQVITAGFPSLFATTNRTFSGVGPRLTGQVRRYLGANRRWSGFASIGGSLLVGSISNVDTRLTLDQDQTFERQSVGGTIVVPNVDISLGGTWQVRPRTSVSVGWMLIYLGSLGYSEIINTAATVPGTPVTSVPLTNSSLSLDGVFFRVSHAF